MENLKEALLRLSQLQELDTKIELQKVKLEQIPSEIEKKKKELEDIKKDFENKKSEYVRLNSLKKEKESVLTERENTIAKQTENLSTVKSNDLYKACMLEIEKAKADKSVVEDEILELMDKIDAEAANLKNYEQDLKKNEDGINAQIKELSDETAKINAETETLKASRDSFTKDIPVNILSQYERIRENRNGQGLAWIDGDSCSGCSMVLRPQLIVQATKCKEIVCCDNCSRILFNKKDVI